MISVIMIQPNFEITTLIVVGAGILVAWLTIIDNKDNFSDQEWKSLYKLSERTFVEESDSSKHGAAGAGLSDND